MKVLYCNPSFWDYRLPFYKKLNEFYNGDFYVLYSTKRYKNGHEKLLYRIKNEMGNNALPYDNEPVFNWRHFTFNSVWEGIPLPFGILPMMRKIKPDILITEGFFQWTPFVLLYAILFRTPVYMGYERTLYTERNNSKFKTWTRKVTDKLIKGYLVNGAETKKYLLSIGVNESKIHIGGMSADSEGLRNGIAILSEEEKTKFKSRFQKKKGLVYLFSGRVEELKGAPHLLAAWMEHSKQYPDDIIVLIGMGDKYEELKMKYKDVHSIFLEGSVEYQNVYKYYAIADVFILPTLQDNWSLVIPEAMSCGLPVATSIYNGCHSELISEGENGTVFDPFKQESIVQSLDFFHGKDLKQMGLKSKEIEKNFNTENCAQRVYSVLNS